MTVDELILKAVVQDETQAGAAAVIATQKAMQAAMESTDTTATKAHATYGKLGKALGDLGYHQEQLARINQKYAQNAETLSSRAEKDAVAAANLATNLQRNSQLLDRETAKEIKRHQDVQKAFATTGNVLTEAAAKNAAALQSMRAAIDPVYEASKKYEAQLLKINADWKAGAYDLRVATRAIEDLNRAYAASSGPTFAAARAAEAHAKAMSNLRAEFDDVYRATRAYEAELARIKTAENEAGLGTAAASAARARAAQTFNTATAAMRGATTAQAGLTEAHEKGTASAGQHAFALRQLGVQTVQFATSVATGAPVWMAFIQQAHQVGDVAISTGTGLSVFGAAARFVGSVLTSVTGIAVITTTALVALGFAAEKNASRMATLQNTLRATRDDYVEMAQAAEAAARAVSSTTSVSTSDARAVTQPIAASPNFAGNQADLERYVAVARDYAAVMGKTIPEAGADFRSMLDDSAAAAKRFADQGLFGFNSAMANNIKLMQDSGDRAGAFSRVFDQMARSVKGAHENTSAFGQAIERLQKSFSAPESAVGKFFIGIGDVVVAQAQRIIDQITALVTAANLAADWVARQKGRLDAQAASGRQAMINPPGTVYDPEGRPVLQSSAGALGIMQIKPTTAADYGFGVNTPNALAPLPADKDITTEVGNIKAGLAYIKDLSTRIRDAQDLIGSYFLGEAGYKKTPEKALAYINAVNTADIQQLPARISDMLETYGKLAGFTPELIKVSKQIATWESSGGNQYTAGAVNPAGSRVVGGVDLSGGFNPLTGGPATGATFGELGPPARRTAAMNRAEEITQSSGGLLVQLEESLAKQRGLQAGIDQANLTGQTERVKEWSQALDIAKAKHTELITEQAKSAAASTRAVAPLALQSTTLRELAAITTKYSEISRTTGEALDHKNLALEQGNKLLELQDAATRQGLESDRQRNQERQLLLKDEITRRTAAGDTAGAAQATSVLKEVQAAYIELRTEQDKGIHTMQLSSAVMAQEEGAARDVAAAVQAIVEAGKRSGHDDPNAARQAQAIVLEQLAVKHNQLVAGIDKEVAAQARINRAYDQGATSVQQAILLAKVEQDVVQTSLKDGPERIRQIENETRARKALNQELADTANKQALVDQRNEMAMLDKERDLLFATNAERSRELAILRATQEVKKNDPELKLASSRERIDMAGRLVDQRTRLTEMQQSIEAVGNALTQVFDNVGNAITQAFANGTMKALDFGKIARAAIASMIAEIGKLALLNPILNSLFNSSRATLGSAMSAMSSGGGGGSLGSMVSLFQLNRGGIFDSGASGSGGMFSGVGSWFSGVGSAAKGFLETPIFGGPTAAQAAATQAQYGAVGVADAPGAGMTWGGAAGAAGSMLGGFGAGMAINSMLGGNQTGGMIGSGLGAIAGFAVGGPVGAMIGGALGGAAGGMFGPGPKHHGWTYHATADPTTGLIAEPSDRYIDEVAQAQFAAEKKQIADLNRYLTREGLRASGDLVVGANNAGKYGEFATFNEGFKQFRFNAGAGTTLDTVVNRAFEDPAALDAAVQFAGVYDKLKAGNIGALAEGIDALNKSYADAADKAVEYGLAEDVLTAARDKEITKLREASARMLVETDRNLQARLLAAHGDTAGAALINFDTAATAQRQQLSDQLKAAYGDAYESTAEYARLVGQLNEVLEAERQNIQEQSRKAAQQAATGSISGLVAFANALNVGASSPLSPQDQYQYAATQFARIAGPATQGDAASIRDFQGSATAFLAASRDIHGSGAAYAADFNQVMAILGMIGSVDADVLTASAMKLATEDQTKTLQDELRLLREAAITSTTVQTTDINTAAGVNFVDLAEAFDAAFTSFAAANTNLTTQLIASEGVLATNLISTAGAIQASAGAIVAADAVVVAALDVTSRAFLTGAVALGSILATAASSATANAIYVNAGQALLIGTLLSAAVSHRDDITAFNTAAAVLVSAMAILAEVEASPRAELLPENAVSADLFSYEFALLRELLHEDLSGIRTSIDVGRAEDAQRAMAPSRIAA